MPGNVFDFVLLSLKFIPQFVRGLPSDFLLPPDTHEHTGATILVGFKLGSPLSHKHVFFAVRVSELIRLNYLRICRKHVYS